LFLLSDIKKKFFVRSIASQLAFGAYSFHSGKYFGEIGKAPGAYHLL
jgi:hypothetical protein